MKIQVYGAGGGEVTGSAYHVQTDAANVLIDFGLFQGSRSAEKLNRVPRGLNPKKLNAVVLTHAHLDHTGRLPLLVQAGFRGPLHATPATIEMADLILHDAAHLQQADADRDNRKRERGGQPPAKPLYTADDVDRLMPLFKPAPYDAPYEAAPGIRVRMVDAGHMLGSTSLELTVQEGSQEKVVVFSGDLGPRGAPFLRDAVPFQRADVVFLESTYGDRDHRPFAETLAETAAIVQRAVEHRGKILVPTFSIGRAQDMLYHLAGLFHSGQVPAFPIYVDSPMAIKATEIYGKYTSLFDEEALALMQSGQLAKDMANVRPCPTIDDSKKLNDMPGPLLILAGAGMCNGGRIVHHLRHNLWRPETTVLIVGYQAEGSLGRQLVDGKKVVNVLGDKIIVRAAIHTLGGFSAHAGQSELLRWLGSLVPSRPRVVLTHGEEQARQALGRLIAERHQLSAIYPALGDAVEV